MSVAAVVEFSSRAVGRTRWLSAVEASLRSRGTLWSPFGFAQGAVRGQPAHEVFRPLRFAVIACFLVALSACKPAPPAALGTLEWDRISVPAPVSEPIVEIRVRDGERVTPGTVLVRLDDARARLRIDAAQADADRLAQALAELEAGARGESRREAAARLQGALASQREARREHQRLRTLVQRGLLGQADLDKANAALETATANQQAQAAALALLDNGSRSEQLAQAAAALRQAQAQIALLRVDLDRLTITSKVDGVVDDLPFHVGDQPAVGQPLALLLTGDHPYARVHVPAVLRSDLQQGETVAIWLDSPPKDLAMPLSGQVRQVRAEPEFTPYYALNGRDASRLSWLAEVDLPDGADALPAGLPLRMELSAAAAPPPP